MALVAAPAFSAISLACQHLLYVSRDVALTEGKRAWVKFHDLIELELRDGGNVHDVRDCASKMADNVTRMTAFFHVVVGRDGPIEADLIRRAATICWWHLNEALRFFGNLTFL